MDLSSFYTQQLQQSGSPFTEDGLQSFPGEAGGLFSGETAVDVFDLLLSQIVDATKNNTDTSDDALGEAAQEVLDQVEALKSDNPLLDDTHSLSVSALLAENPEIAKEMKAIVKAADLDLIQEIQQTIALNQLAFDDKLSPIEPPETHVNEDTVEGRKDAAENTVHDFIEVVTQYLEDQNNVQIEAALKTAAQEQDVENLEKAAILLTSNLTPEELTKLQEDGAIDDPQDVIEATSGLNTVNIVPAQITQDIPVTPQMLALIMQGGVTKPANQNTPDITARLNDLITGGVAKDSLQGVTQPGVFGNDAAELGEGDADFETLLRSFSGKKHDSSGQGFELPKASNAPSSPPPANSAIVSNLSVVPELSALITSALLSPNSVSQELAQALGLHTPTSGMNVFAAPSSLITQAQNAGQAHPATQLVAASIQKSGVNGQDTNITLRLDPPDLGRVDVRLNFGKDKAVQTIVRVENQETLNLLQRDSQILERSLQDAGLETDGGISFEMSENGDFFDRNNQRGGGHDEGGTGAGEDNDLEEVIETTMTWHIDPESGHTRYNLLV